MDNASRTSFLKLTLLGAGLPLAIATISFAQSYDPDVGSGNVAYSVQSDGSTSRLGGRTARVNSSGHAMITKHASELKPGSVLYRSGNKLYALDNQMIDGKMVEDHAKGWTE